MSDEPAPERSPEPSDEAPRSRLVRAKPVAAVHRRYAGSIAQDVGRTLADLDVANQATLLGAGLLASLLPLLILLSAFADSRVDDDITLRLGLNHRAEAIVTGLFQSSPARISLATVSSLVFVVAGTVAVASSLQLIYERLFGQSHRGVRDLPRRLIWIAAVCGVIALDSVIGRPIRDASGGRGLVDVVSAAIFTLFFWWTVHFLLAGRVGWRRLLPSAVATGALFVVLDIVSELYFSAVIITDSRTFGAIGAVFSLLTWLIAVSAVVILGAAAGAVWQERRAGIHP